MVRGCKKFLDHLRSSVVYNFSTVCLSVCMYWYICQMITCESLDVGSSFIYKYLEGLIWIKFAYAGNRVQIKVTGAKRSKIPIPAT